MLALSIAHFYITGVRDHKNDIKNIEEKIILKRRGMISAVILFIINLLFLIVDLWTLTNVLTLAFVSEVKILSLQIERTFYEIVKEKPINGIIIIGFDILFVWIFKK